MASLNTAVFHAIENNPKERYFEGAGILLKLLENVIKEPDNSKFRTIRLENKIIKEKLLCLNGIKECLEYIGFEEMAGELRLPSNVLIAQIKKYRDYLTARIEEFPNRHGMSTGAFSKITIPAAPQTVVKQIRTPPFPTSVKPFHDRIQFSRVIPHQNKFLQSMETHSDRVMQYEDPVLLEYAKSLIPYAKLEKIAIERMRIAQKLMKSQTSSVTDPCFRDCLLVELANWFNGEFFRWIDSMPCKHCGGIDGPGRDFYMDNDTCVETFLCCNEITKFHRYNDVGILLRTRMGRCGEYANCFTLLCRAMGFTARLVVATFDHVWTEVYSLAQKRWLHVDPSDNVIDAPLMYQHGWKRSVDYVIAYSRDDVQDVTHRYANNHDQLKEKRTLCTEEELLQAITLLRRKRQVKFSKILQRNLARRALYELADLMTPKIVTEDERKGRSSGNMAWKLSRGEQNVDNFHIFTAGMEEINAKQFNLRYSTAKNCYERYILQSKEKPAIIKSYENWESCHYQASNIFRKVERDWKVVYLARTEDSDRATISWKFNFTEQNLKIQSVFLRFETKTYENGNIEFLILNENDIKVNSVTDLLGANKFTLSATLTGGKGDVAWQHTQLFRHPIDAVDYPFELKIVFQ